MTDEHKAPEPIGWAQYMIDRFFDTLDIVVRQLTSGRWIMTVAAAYILIHYCLINVEPAKIIDICKDIVIFYFVVKNAMNERENQTKKGAGV